MNSPFIAREKQVLDHAAFQRAMLEKLVWISAYMAVGVRHGGCSVGRVESEHGDEATALVRELAAAGAGALGISLRPGVVERLAAYARSVAGYPTALKEWEWRNGWFQGLSRAALAAGRPDPCPLHSALLAELGR
jgi:hypothetical protein